jgi:ABC-type polar amino acid transport system ATPase subunit
LTGCRARCPARARQPVKQFGQMQAGGRLLDRLGDLRLRLLHHLQDMTRQPATERGIAMVFQSYALYPNMTVRGNLAYFITSSG